MRILLVQTGFLGDTVLSTPCIAAILAQHPQAQLYVMTNPLAAELLKFDRRISGVIPFSKRANAAGLRGLFRTASELKKLNFDLVYSLHRSARTSLLLWLARIPQRIGSSDANLKWLYTKRRTRPTGTHAVLRHLAIINELQEQQPLDIVLYTAPEEEISDDIKSLSQERLAILFPGSEWETKRWWWQHYRTLAQELLQRGFKVVLLGSLQENQLCSEVAEGLDIVNLAGQLSIAESVYLVSKTSLLVCNDSLALHLGSAFKVPTVAVFCATSPSFGFGPWQNPRASVVEKGGLACRPCRRHGSRECPTGTQACMQELYPLAVLNQIERVLAA